MNKFLKTGLAALMFGGGLAVVPAAAQSFDPGYGPPGGIDFSYDSGGYCDDYGCPDDFWNMPVYYGPVYWSGAWYDGPVYYRDWYGQRQFWIHGNWRFDDWRGPRPSWYHQGRFGPALGVEFYRSNGFHGRWDNNRGFNGRAFNPGRDGARPLDRRDDRRGGFQQQQQQGPQRGGGFRNNAPRQQAAPQTQTPPANTGGGRGGRNFQPRNNPPANTGGGNNNGGGNGHDHHRR